MHWKHVINVGVSWPLIIIIPKAVEGTRTNRIVKHIKYPVGFPLEIKDMQGLLKHTAVKIVDDCYKHIVTQILNVSFKSFFESSPAISQAFNCLYEFYPTDIYCVQGIFVICQLLRWLK